MTDPGLQVTFEEAPPLPAWLAPAMPYQRRVAVVGDYRVHFVDHGAGLPVVMQHGNPTWSFLWRKVLAALDGSGLRLIAPDLVGLGLSTKPRALSWHTLDHHSEVMTALVRALVGERFIAVGQDWGGPIVGSVCANLPERVAGVVFANTGVSPPSETRPLSSFHKLAHTPVVSDFVFRVLGMPQGALHKVQGDPASIGAFERRCYQWPLRKLADRAAPLALARMVPTGPGHPTTPAMQRVDEWARRFDGAAALVWGKRDPILGRLLPKMQEIFPDAPVTETDAGHFLQEEVPDAIAAAIRDVAARTA